MTHGSKQIFLHDTARVPILRSTRASPIGPAKPTIHCSNARRPTAGSFGLTASTIQPGRPGNCARRSSSTGTFLACPLSIPSARVDGGKRTIRISCTSSSTLGKGALIAFFYYISKQISRIATRPRTTWFYNSNHTAWSVPSSQE